MRVSTSTTGLVDVSEAPISEIVATWLADRLSPRTCVRIVEPGLKPSLPSHAVGSNACPPAVAGNAPAGKSIRRPVARAGSGAV